MCDTFCLPLQIQYNKVYGEENKVNNIYKLKNNHGGLRLTWYIIDEIFLELQRA